MFRLDEWSHIRFRAVDKTRLTDPLAFYRLFTLRVR